MLPSWPVRSPEGEAAQLLPQELLRTDLLRSGTDLLCPGTDLLRSRTELLRPGTVVLRTVLQEALLPEASVPQVLCSQLLRADLLRSGTDLLRLIAKQQIPSAKMKEPLAAWQAVLYFLTPKLGPID